MSGNAKKRLMFLTGEDYYFFTYSLLLLLKTLECKNGKYFKDYRKLPFLIEIINDDNLIFIIAPRSVNGDEQIDESADEVANRQLNSIDKEYLFRSYSVGMARRSEILKILFTLEKSGYVTLRKGDHEFEIDVCINTNSIPAAFFDKKVFAHEIANTLKLKSIVKRLSALTFKTMIEKIYDRHGIKTWTL
jgi:hypothetical protein